MALAPMHLKSLTKAGLEILIEKSAGVEAGFPDAEYEEHGARIVESREELLQAADVVLQVRAYGANLQEGKADVERLRKDQTVIGTCDPLTATDAIGELTAAGISLYSMELIPRITRAQSMDVLSSMATIAGYKAVLLAADSLPKMFPMMMTAAGTLTPAKVFVIGAGVAGLQALSVARRLGAVTSGYDVRPVVKEQVESVGAKFIEMELETEKAEGKGGYAKQMDEEFYRKQRELLTKVVAENDVVITTAAIPGRPAPVLITDPMLEGMAPGSVIVDLAAERGGNCEASQADEVVVRHGVTVLGPTNLPAGAPCHASQMYSKNLTTFLLHLHEDGKLQHEADDEII
ncbi:MAG: NAD(P) transhydrogenase subunit alpha, partial [Planctomycetales bacterium]